MSLVGNLEDLSLGDIMQIISLSQKSGVLALESDDGSGRIFFQSGLVQAACVKGRPSDLRGLLFQAGLVEGDRFDVYEARARELGLSVADTISREGELTSERIEALIRESVESAILEMFLWSSGDFSFDVRSQLETDDPQLLLSSGINAQYLAMEGMRIRDENSRDASDASIDSIAATSQDGDFPLANDLFGDEPLETGPDFSARSDAAVRDASSDEFDSDELFSAADILVATVLPDAEEALSDSVFVLEDSTPEVVVASTPVVPAQSVPEPVKSLTRQMPIILIDSDMTVLDWVKSAIREDFARVHSFQQAEQGLNRIRQYLIRGEMPVVLISTKARIDPLSGIHGLKDFVDRLKTQAERLLVLGLHQQDDENPAPRLSAFDAVLVHPATRQLRNASEEVAAVAIAEFSQSLQKSLSERAQNRPVPAATAAAGTSGSLRQLRDATANLQEASSRGEVLPVVLDFASQIFARVAILIVREEQVFAIAGRGIDTLMVDPLDSAPPVSLQALDNGWIRSALETGKPVQRPASTAADRDLLASLGGLIPDSSYVGPIESGGSTIALLYCDQAAGHSEMPDTSGLEVVLHHAGLALDRAALERALWEADAGKD